MILDSAIYVDGHREESPGSLGELYEACRVKGGLAWVDLYEPSAEELASVTEEFDLHPVAHRAYRRPAYEQYGSSAFVVLKTARYVDESETVEFGDLHVFAGPDFVVTIHRGKGVPPGELHGKLDGEPGVLRRGAAAVLYAIVDRVVWDYNPVVEGLENDVDEIEDEVFGGNPGVSRRIYELHREVIQFHRATEPLAAVLERMIEEGSPDREALRYLRGVQGQLLRVIEQVEGLRELLSSILSVNLTLLSIQQNDQVKKISAWAAILVVPTLITGIYGMNFRYMPELSWPFGYPLALLLMAAISLLLYRAFKRSGWL